MFAKLKPYSKFIIALIGAVVTVVVQYYGDHTAVQAVVSLLTAAGVYQVPNTPVE